MENLIYWNGKAVGIESRNMIQWFPSAPKEAIEKYGKELQCKSSH